MSRSTLEIAIMDEIDRLVAQGYKKLSKMSADVQVYDRNILGKSYSFEVRVRKEKEKVFVLVEASRNFLILGFFGIQRAFFMSSTNETKIISATQFPDY